MKECGEISTNYKVSVTLSNSATLSLRASTIVVNPSTVSTTAVDPTPTITDNSATATKSIIIFYFL